MCFYGKSTTKWRKKVKNWYTATIYFSMAAWYHDIMKNAKGWANGGRQYRGPYGRQRCYKRLVEAKWIRLVPFVPNNSWELGINITGTNGTNACQNITDLSQNCARFRDCKWSAPCFLRDTHLTTLFIVGQTGQWLLHWAEQFIQISLCVFPIIDWVKSIFLLSRVSCPSNGFALISIILTFSRQAEARKPRVYRRI